MKYKCLIMDHDDTTVNSTTNVHYPSFVEYMKVIGLKNDFTLEDYVRYNFNPGIIPFFIDICGMTEKQTEEEQLFWREYTKKHVSEAFPGIKRLLDTHRKNGGIIAVVSHSVEENIERDYEHNELPMPDAIYGWNQPKEERKPSTVPVEKIMKEFNLKPEDILIVDDLKPGLDMARAAGVDFAAAGWCFDIPENEKYMRENADYYFKTVDELLDFLEY